MSEQSNLGQQISVTDPNTGVMLTIQAVYHDIQITIGITYLEYKGEEKVESASFVTAKSVFQKYILPAIEEQGVEFGVQGIREANSFISEEEERSGDRRGYTTATLVPCGMSGKFNGGDRNNVEKGILMAMQKMKEAGEKPTQPERHSDKPSNRGGYGGRGGGVGA